MAKELWEKVRFRDKRKCWVFDARGVGLHANYGNYATKDEAVEAARVLASQHTLGILQEQPKKILGADMAAHFMAFNEERVLSGELGYDSCQNIKRTMRDRLLKVKIDGKPLAKVDLGKVELKTQWDGKAYTDKPAANSLPSDIKEPHLYQIAGYWHLSGIIPKIVYANRMGYRVFEPTQEQLEFGLTRIIEACRRRERLMLAADTTEKLLRLTDPQWSHIFGWKDMNPELLHRAKKIWSE